MIHADGWRHNVSEQLLWRELGAAAGIGLQQKWKRESLSRIEIQAVYVESKLAPGDWITELLVTPQHLVTLTKTGACSVFDKCTAQYICCLNQSQAERVLSMYHSKRDNSLFTVADGFQGQTGLYCTKFNCRQLTSGASSCQGTPLLRGETLSEPGFIEFGEGCDRALVYQPSASVYRLYDLASLQLLYCLSAESVWDAQMGVQYLVLLVSSRNPHKLKLRVISAPNGLVLQEGSTTPPATLGHTAVMGSHLLLQGSGLHPLHIYELPSLACTAVLHDPAFGPATRLLYMPLQDVLLAINGTHLSSWDMQGCRLAEFENHQLWYAQDESCYLVEQEGWVISYCRATQWGTALPAATDKGAVHVSDVQTGRLIAAVSLGSELHVDMSDVTAICYDAEDSALYTANETAFSRVAVKCTSRVAEAALRPLAAPVHQYFDPLAFLAGVTYR